METLVSRTVKVVKESASFEIGHKAKVIKESDRWLTLEGGKRVSRKSTEIVDEEIKSTKDKVVAKKKTSALWEVLKTGAQTVINPKTSIAVLWNCNEGADGSLNVFMDGKDTSDILEFKGAQATEHMAKRLAIAVTSGLSLSEISEKFRMPYRGTELSVIADDKNKPLNDRFRELHTMGVDTFTIAALTGAKYSRVCSFIKNKITKKIK